MRLPWIKVSNVKSNFKPTWDGTRWKPQDDWSFLVAFWLTISEQSQWRFDYKLPLNAGKSTVSPGLPCLQTSSNMNRSPAKIKGGGSWSQRAEPSSGIPVPFQKNSQQCLSTLCSPVKACTGAATLKWRNESYASMRACKTSQLGYVNGSEWNVIDQSGPAWQCPRLRALSLWHAPPEQGWWCWCIHIGFSDNVRRRTVYVNFQRPSGASGTSYCRHIFHNVSAH